LNLATSTNFEHVEPRLSPVAPKMFEPRRDEELEEQHPKLSQWTKRICGIAPIESSRDGSEQRLY
jgi:hypothetical protein